MTSKNLSTVIDSWIKFDFQQMQRELDAKVIEIAQQQEEGDQSKKRLIEQSKEFKKNANEETRKTVGPVLKLFQSEIDNLSKRNKSIETLYLNLYKRLIDLPDPSVAFSNTQQLQKKAERVQDLEIENKQLRETLDEYNNEFAHVKNQEVTIRQLKEKIKEQEEKNEQTVQTQLREKEKDLLKHFSEKEEQSKNIQLELVKKLGETEAKNLNLQNQMHKLQADLFEVKTKQDELLNAKACEIDLLLQDLDRSNDRASSAERLLEQYLITQKENEKKQIEDAHGGGGGLQTASVNVQNTIDQITKTTLEIELAAKEREITQLVEDIHKLQMKSTKSKELFDTEKNNLEVKISKQMKIIEELEENAKLKIDYDEIKRELNILKSIEFNFTTNSDMTLVDSDQQQQQLQQHESKSLDFLLFEKNRHLQSENTQLKVQLNDHKTKYEEEKSKTFNLVKTAAEQKQLIAELEQDLLNLARNTSSGGIKQTRLLQATSPAILFDADDLNSDVTGAAASSEYFSSNNNSNNNNNNNEKNIDENSIDNNNQASLLNIVSSQRERFRLRIQELELETISYKQQFHILQGDIERLRADNVKLYEKIRFLQSYDSNNSFRKAKTSTEDDLVLNKYTNEYEQKLDPFSKFTNKERQRSYANLKLHDKFTLSLGRFILSSKTARFIFCCYILIIHLLIFLSTYRVAHSETSHRSFSAECANMYKAHMSDVHGQKDFDLH